MPNCCHDPQNNAHQKVPRTSTICLTTKAVEGTALSLERIDDVEGGDGLALSVFSVGDGITDDRFEERFEDSSGLFIDHCRLVSSRYEKAMRVATYWQRYASHRHDERDGGWQAW